MVIVYQSNTGFTRQYAEMLAKAEKMKIYELEDGVRNLEKGTEVLYMGPLMGGHIEGSNKALMHFELKAACAVGMSPPGEKVKGMMERANQLPEGIPVFYLQGGWAPDKVPWAKRKMVEMVTKGFRRELENKSIHRTPEEQANLDMLVKGGSFVTFKSLDPVRDWLKEQNG